MLKDIASKINGVVDRCSERLDRYELKVSLCAPSSVIVKDFVCIVSLLKSLSERDQFSLMVEVSGNPESIVSCSDSEVARIIEFIESFDEEDEEAVFTLKVDKKCEEGILSIYDVTMFSEYLDGESLANLFVAFYSRFSAENRLIFAIQDDFDWAGSDTIFFCGKSHQHCLKPISQEVRSKQIALFKESSYGPKELDGFLPSDFHFKGDCRLGAIKKFMDRACAVLSAVFLCNVSELQEGGQLSYKMTGYKSVESGSATIDELERVKGLLYSICRWAYEDGTSDKLGLARNIISLHSARLESLSNEQEIMSALQSNYQVYLKGNVATYLELKGKIAEFVLDTVTKTHLKAEDVLKTVKSSFFAVLTFLFTVVLVNAFKDIGFLGVFSLKYLGMTTALSLFLSAWVVMSKNIALKSFRESSEVQKKLLHRNFDNLILKEEIDGVFDPAFEDNDKYLKSQVTVYMHWWFGIVGAALSFLAWGVFFFDSA